MWKKMWKCAPMSHPRFRQFVFETLRKNSWDANYSRQIVSRTDSDNLCLTTRHYIFPSLHCIYPFIERMPLALVTSPDASYSHIVPGEIQISHIIREIRCFAVHLRNDMNSHAKNLERENTFLVMTRLTLTLWNSHAHAVPDKKE